jgi:uncharacterized protein YoxC
VADTDQPSLAELDEVLSRAVERQISEQRALRQALEELRQAVATSARPTGEPAAVDLTPIEDRITRTIETGIERLETELREVRQTLEPQLQVAADASKLVRSVQDDMDAISALQDDIGLVRSMRDEMTGVRAAVGSLGADIEGIAQALIDLNSGLRTWADDVDSSVESVRETVDSVGEAVASIRELAQTRAVAEAAEPGTPPPELTEPPEPPEGLEQQVKELAELSLYLNDQIEDLDGVLKRLGELPEKVDGVVAQAMRRTLATRSKIEQEATNTFDEVAADLEDNLQRLTVALGALDDATLRKVTLGHVELSSRVESLHETLLARIEDVAGEQRRTAEALAESLDRSARGQDPRASAAVSRVPATRGRVRAKARKTTAQTDKPTTKTKKAAKKKKTTAKRSTARRKTTRNKSEDTTEF